MKEGPRAVPHALYLPPGYSGIPMGPMQGSAGEAYPIHE